MKIVSCNYTGNIPGIGRGPVINVKISDSLYKQLSNMGYNLRITVSKASPVAQVTKVMHVPSLEEKRAAKLADADNNTPSAKVSSPKKDVPETKDETKTTKEPAQVEESSKAESTEAAQTEVAEETPKKTFTSENLEEATDEELEAIIPKDVKRPVRYGRKWLLKTALTYV